MKQGIILLGEDDCPENTELKCGTIFKMTGESIIPL